MTMSNYSEAYRMVRVVDGFGLEDLTRAGWHLLEVLRIESGHEFLVGLPRSLLAEREMARANQVQEAPAPSGAKKKARRK